MSLQQDGTVVAKQMDLSGLLFGDPVAFLAFLGEVIKRFWQKTELTQSMCQSQRQLVDVWVYR